MSKQADMQQSETIESTTQSSFGLVTLNKIDYRDDRYDETLIHLQAKNKVLCDCLVAKGWKNNGFGQLVRPDYNGENLDSLTEGIDYVRSDWQHGATYQIDSCGYEVLDQRYNLLYSKYVSNDTSLEVEKANELTMDIISRLMGNLSMGSGTSLNKTINALAIINNVQSVLEAERVVLERKEKEQFEMKKREQQRHEVEQVELVHNEPRKDRTVGIGKMLSGAISTDNVLENIFTSSAEDMDEDSVNLEYHAEKQEVDEPSAVTGDITTPNQRQTRKVKIDGTLNIEFEFAPDSTEVSFDNDNDNPMQVTEPTEDQDNDVQPSPWNGVSAVGSSVNTQVSTLSNALQRVRESIEEYS